MKKTLFGTFFVLFALASLFGADITIPRLEWFSRGSMVNDELVISSAAEAELAVNGGYKYGITLGLGLEVPNMERAISYGRLNLRHAASPGATEYNALVDEVNDRSNNQAVLSFRMLEASARELFGKPLDFSFFIGKYDALASGDDFALKFGAVPIGTDLRGFFYYADGLRVLDPQAPPPSVPPENDPGIRFNGAIHTIAGTGGKIAYAPSDRIITSLYVYQDLSFKDADTGAYKHGHYSGDLSLLVNSERIKLEAFAGSTYINDRVTKEKKPVFRGGVLAYFSSGVGTDLLLQAGIPYWRTGEEFGIDNCYFLLEPRFRFGVAGLTLTFFYRPSYYNNQMIVDENGEREHGLADINAKLFFGDLAAKAVQGGIEGTVELSIQESEEVKIWLSPFLSVVSSGLLWDFKVRVNPRYFTSGESTLAEGYIGIRTSF
ncbi:MAG: hypothetical protein LBB82_09915 [Treponema sp.]|jgi:hypothetical protein|nr:hypothetical protein [Treponema sp.]